MKDNFIVVNGILNNPQDIDGWTDIFEDLYQNMGYPCTKYEYFSGALTRFIKQNERVDQLCKIVKRTAQPLIYVGHSNGCELFDKVVRRLHKPYFESAHLFSPAMESDFNTNGLNYCILSGKVKKVYLYCSKGDKILRDWASKTSFLKFIGLGYGTLGYDGPKNVLRAVDDRVIVHWENSYNHSDWFNKHNIDKSFSSTLIK